MDTETLERLATDRALGAMNADVEELFDACMRRDAAASRVADETRRTVEIAREAMREHPPSSMPAFPLEGFKQIDRWRRRVAAMGYAAGLAACLIIGIFIGRPSSPGATPRPVVHVSPPAAVPVVQRADEDGFWSIERLLKQREQSSHRSQPPRQTYDIRWPGSSS